MKKKILDRIREWIICPSCMETISDECDGIEGEEIAYAEDVKELGELYYSHRKLFDLWIDYLDYYDITFQELSRTFNVEYSFPKWLEENKK